MDNPCVSVCIPAYNVEKSLRACLNSVVNQTLKNIEIIVVNDGSTDGSMKIIDEYARLDKRVKYIKHLKNLGPSDARKSAVDIARGDYLGFVDSDDTVNKTMFETLYKEAQKYEADVSVCLIKRIEKYRVIISPCLNRNRVEENIYGNITPEGVGLSFWNKLWKRSLFKNRNIEFRKHFYLGEDVLVTSMLWFYAKKVAIVNEALYAYNSSLSGKEVYIEKASKYANIIYHDLEKFYREESVFEDYRDSLNEMVGKLVTFYLKIIFFCKKDRIKNLVFLYKSLQGEGFYIDILDYLSMAVSMCRINTDDNFFVVVKGVDMFLKSVR